MSILNLNIYEDLSQLRDEFAHKAFDGPAGEIVKDPVLGEVVYKINECMYKNSKSRKLMPASSDFLKMTEEELKAMWVQWYPSGSGPLSAMRNICSLVEAVAMLRGFDVSMWVNNPSDRV